MSKTMTPSEIAAYFDKMKNGKYGAWATKAAATIRNLEAKNKIATEALERIALTPLSLAECISVSHQALARIKEVGA